MDIPTFSNPQDEADYWKQKACEFKRSLDETREELEEFQGSSRDLELELEAQLEQSETRCSDYKQQLNRLAIENDQYKEENDAKSKEKRVAAKGFRLPDPIQAGEILTDMNNKHWRLGRSIGTGGFGEIYMASDDIAGVVDDSAPYCVKIEPHSNGPLFTEMHCYMRIAKWEDIQCWMVKRNLEQIGMPRYIGAGSHMYKGSKYRFLIMERFGVDFQKVLKKYKRLSLKTVYQVGLQVIDVLEYIHSKEFIHGDIKAANLLIGHHSGQLDQVFLVDFGLASHYAFDGRHKEYKYDGRRAHYGTIEFTSRDAHIGTYSRRGDFEVLLYNMIKWVCGDLPWEDNLEDWDYVASQKRNCMEDIPSFMKQCFGETIVKGINELLEYIGSMAFDEPPDYDKCRNILRQDLISHGYVDDGELILMPLSESKSNFYIRPYNNNHVSSSKNSDSKDYLSATQEDCEMQKTKACRVSPNDLRITRVTRALSQNEPDLLAEHSLSNAYFDDSPMLDGEELMILKEQQKMEKRKHTLKAVTIQIKRDNSLDNPTPQMIELMDKIYEKSLLPPPCTKRHKHTSICGILSVNYDDEPSSDFTPEMKAVMRRKSERKNVSENDYILSREFLKDSVSDKCAKSNHENVSPVCELDFPGFTFEEQSQYKMFLDDYVGEEFSGFTTPETSGCNEYSVSQFNNMQRFHNFSDALQMQLSSIEVNNVKLSSAANKKSNDYKKKSKSKHTKETDLNPSFHKKTNWTRGKTLKYSNQTNDNLTDNTQSIEGQENLSHQFQKGYQNNVIISGTQIRSKYRARDTMQFGHSGVSSLQCRKSLHHQSKRELRKHLVTKHDTKEENEQTNIPPEKGTSKSAENVMSFIGRETRLSSQCKNESRSEKHKGKAEPSSSSDEHSECKETSDKQRRRSGRKISATPKYVFNSSDEEDSDEVQTELNTRINKYKSISVTDKVQHKSNNENISGYVSDESVHSVESGSNVSDDDYVQSFETGNRVINVSIDNLDDSLEFLPQKIRLTRRMVREVMGD